MPVAYSYVSAILKLVNDDKNGIATETICDTLKVPPQNLGSDFEQIREEGKLIGFAGLWFTEAGFKEGVRRFEQALLACHQQKPKMAGIAPERVAALAGLTWSGKRLYRITESLEEQGMLSRNDDGIRHHTHPRFLSPKQRRFLDRAKAAIEDQGLLVPDLKEIARRIPAPIPAVQEILRIGEDAKEIAAVAEGMYYTDNQIVQITQMLQAFGAGKLFTPAQFRDALKVTRKYAIPIMEYLDESGITVRRGERRYLKGDVPPPPETAADRAVESDDDDD